MSEAEAGRRAPRVLVVGCGNESRRDDGVGLYVIRELARRLALREVEDTDAASATGEVPTPSGTACVELRFEHQLDLVLADDLRAVDRFVVVDAHTGAFPETLRRVELHPGYESSMTSHHLTPETLVGLARALHGHVPRAVLFSIRGYDFNFGTDLTPATRAAADQAVEEILGFVIG
ncbi:MAG: hydrogenase maturation protease [Armatimonadetes bacterium]|nr:hydrogenase maturation protease [Armatimonadota bacterium]